MQDANTRKGFKILCQALAFLFMMNFATLASAQSSENSTVTITRGDAVRITNIDDWLIGVYTATDTIPTIIYNWDYQCVFTTTGLYGVTVTSQNGGAQLTLASAAGDTMAYEIYSYSRQNGGGFELRRHLTPTINLTNRSGSTSPTCADETAFANTNLFFAPLVLIGVIGGSDWRIAPNRYAQYCR